MSRPVDVLAILDEAEGLLRMDRYQAIPDDLIEVRAAVAELIEIAALFDSYVAADMGDTSILDNEGLWDRLSCALARVRGAA